MEQQQDQDMATKNKTGMVVGIIVLIIIIIGIIVLARSKKAAAPVEETPAATAGETTSGTAQTPATDAIDITGLSYADIIKAYDAKGRRIQFGEDCAATPLTANYKVGTKILIDNRSQTAKTFTIGTAKYPIAAWGYQIYALNTTKDLPTTVSVDCGAKQNVLSITLQK